MTKRMNRTRRPIIIIAVCAVGLILLSAGYAAYRSSGVPPAKQALLDQQQADMANAIKVAKGLPDPPAPTQLPARQPGVIDMHQGPFPGSEFDVENFWQGTVAGSWLLVYAGGPRDASSGDVTGGGIRIYTEPVDPNTGSTITPVGVYSSDSPTPLTITSVTGQTMTLVSAGGTSYSFNLSTKSFAG